MNSRLFVILGCCISLGAGALTVGAVWDARKAALTQASISAENISHAIQTGISRTFETYALSIEGARDALQNPAIATLPPELRRLTVFDRAADASNLGSVLVLDKNGRIVLDSRNGPPRTADLSDREYFTAQQNEDGLYISAPFVSRIDGAWSVALSRRVSDPDGGFAGVVVGTIKLDYLRDLFASLSAGPLGTVSLFRSDGVLLMRSPYDVRELGKNFANVGVFKHFRNARSGTFDQVAVRDGVERRYVYGQIGNLPLVFSIGLAFDDILQDWTRKAMVIGGLTAMLFAAMITLGIMLALELRRRRSAEQKAIEHADRFVQLAEKASDAIVLRDAAGVRRYASPKFYEFLGRTPEEVGPRGLSAYLHPECRDVPAVAMLGLICGEPNVSEILQIVRPDGECIWLEALSSAVRAEDGTLREVITTMRDITEQRLNTERMLQERQALEAAANHDALTGAHNRRSFELALAHETQQSARSGQPLTVLMIDVDHFKSYNDALGHPAGDAALKAVAQSLRAGARRPGDFVARYGGEEFVVLLPNTDRAAAHRVAEDLCQAIRALALPHPRGDVVTASIGVATSLGGMPPDMLVQAADRALYCAKANGRDCVRAVEDMICAHQSALCETADHRGCAA